MILSERPGDACPRARSRRARSRSLGRAGCAVAALGLLSCAGVERGRYGVNALKLEGMRALDERALSACLLTRERASFELKLGVSEPSCGQAPFDESAPRLRLWRWPWTEWPSFNPAVLDNDQERVLRWYRARGYYRARIVSVQVDPPAAASPGSEGDCAPERERCTVDVLITIDEGEPARVTDIEWRVNGPPLAPEVLDELRTVVALAPGNPVDESLYEASKAAIVRRLLERGHAAARVHGRVHIDTAGHAATIGFELEPGPVYRFGELVVSGHGELPEGAIRAAAGLRPGTRYDPRVLSEIESEVFGLGAFSAVQVATELDHEGQSVRVLLGVTPLPNHALRTGVGVLSGGSRRTETGELTSIPQWDVHVFGRYERRHVFGSLGRLGIDDRARLIFPRDFPRLAEPQLGNVLGLSLNQPGLIEARTDLFARAAWDRGPDSFLGFTRSDVFLRVGVRRSLLLRGLVGTLALQQDLLLVDRGTTTSTGEPPPDSYGFAYFEQDLRLDLRDDPLRTTRGAFVQLNATEAVRSPLSDWTAFRLAPEARGYVPLPFGIVVAARAAVAGLFIQSSSPDLDAESRALGPSTYRLRGGGANSNRGFLAGRLGAGVEGGLRRWEGSLELRVPFGANFVLAGFADVGDVNAGERLRLSHLNTSLGFGLRYYTILGALRLDLGYRLRGLQRADGSDGIEPDATTLPFSDTPGALHLTIGDAF